jgi:hypothetical protein
MKRKKASRPSRTKPGSIRHPSLYEALLKRVRACNKVPGEVAEDTLDEIIDDFRRDTDPEREIQLWERIARIYRSFVAENSITDLHVKQEVFSVVLGSSLGMKAKDFYGLKLLSNGQINSILRCWKAPFAQDVM